jgi:Na+/H+ antiporter NhaD/arsenite permease-like protein
MLHEILTIYDFRLTILPARTFGCFNHKSISPLASDTAKERISGMLAASLIFLGTYLVLALGRLPGFRVDRTGAAIIGASLMIAFNILSLEEVYASIDHNTILLLFGMMIVVANLRLSGFFTAVSEWTVENAHHPLTLLAAIIFVAGAFSAFFVNDTMCLVLTPLVLETVIALKRNPVPYLLAVAMASNVGSVATITGNPQNMMIGAYSGIPYRHFAAAMMPVGAIGLILVFGIIAVYYRKEFRQTERVILENRHVRVNRVLMCKSLVVSGLMILFFFIGWPIAKVAVVAGALLLVTRRVKPEKIYHEIDFSLLILFIGLFIVIAGIDKTSLPADALALISGYGLERPVVLSSVAAVLSNLASNVPAVLLFKPLVPHFADPGRAWLILAMASTLAGNLTVLGSIANLIVIQRSKSHVTISFWEYFKVGLPITAATIAVGVWLL